MFNTHQAVLLIIDVQTRLAEKVLDAEVMAQNNLRLIQAAKILDVPILVTEQVPEKIGPTIALLTDELSDTTKISKKSFSCCGEESFNQHLKKLKRQQIIIAGMETHVCVFQTAVHLLEQSYQVQIVADAVSSRSSLDKEVALSRMGKRGCTITTAEMVITELLQSADHPKFKEVLNLIK